MWCFPLLIFLTGITIVMFLAVFDGNIMENGSSLQNLLFPNGKLLLFSKQLCQCMGLQDMLGAPGVAGFIA